MKLWGRSLPVINKQIGVDLCRNPGHVRLSLCFPVCLFLFGADMRMCLFIHNALSIAAAPSCVFIYICGELASLPKAIS